MLNGIALEQVSDELKGLGINTYLEEIHGYTHMFKNQGLYYGHNLPLDGVKFYQSQLSIFNVSFPSYPNKFNWIYKIPRRW